MIVFDKLRVKTPEREILVDITEDVENLVRSSGIKEGTCRIFVPHTTAAITINENADPAVKKDIIKYLSKLIPRRGADDYAFTHGEGNSDAHIKASLIGPSIEIIIHNGGLVLGTWQGIMFAEFDGPRNRMMFVQLRGEK